MLNPLVRLAFPAVRFMLEDIARFQKMFNPSASDSESPGIGSGCHPRIISGLTKWPVMNTHSPSPLVDFMAIDIVGLGLEESGRVRKSSPLFKNDE